MNCLSKKGLSTVVATSMILLLTVIAVATLGAFAIPFVKEKLQKSSECVDYGEYFQFEDSLDFNCYTKNGGNIDYKLSIRAKNDRILDSKIGGFNLEFYRLSSSKTVEVSEGKKTADFAPDAFSRIGDSSGIVKIPRAGELYTFNYRTQDIDEYSFVDIYPVLTNGRICDKKSSRLNNIKQCLSS